jgi:peptide/nickel transport system permease protein
MGFFLVKRLLTLIITLVATSVIVFAVLEILPGNAAQVLMGPDADPAAVAAKAVELGWISPPCPATCTGSAGCCAATWACPTPTAPRSPS